MRLAASWFRRLCLAFVGLGLWGRSSGGAYRADSLAVFVPQTFEYFQDDDVSLQIGRLRDVSEVMALLGPGSRTLARNAAIFQIRMVARKSPVTVSSFSFKLQVPTGEVVEPLSSNWVSAFMSFPSARHGIGIPAVGPENLETTEAAGLVGLTALGLATEAIARSGPEQYWEAAGADVESKTALPRQIPAGQSLDLLLVYWPKTGKITVVDSLAVALELTQNGQVCRKKFVIGLP